MFVYLANRITSMKDQWAATRTLDHEADAFNRGYITACQDVLEISLEDI